MNSSKLKKIFCRILPIILIPILGSLSVISVHSTRLVIVPINYIVYILFSLFVYLFLLGFFIIKKDKNKFKRNKLISALLIIISSIYILCACTCLFLLYGPYNKFRTWLISTSMQTMNHQYICKWFYSDDEINKVLKNNYILEVNEDTDTSLIDLKENLKYDNEYEKQILKRKKDAKYKIIKLTVNDQNAWLVAVYDPSMVKVAASKLVGKKGQYVTKMASDNKALLAINGGGFDNAPGDTTGGWPTGVTIVNKKIISDNNYFADVQSGGLIGMTDDNKLVLIKNATAKKALEAGVRDGVSWGPFLIVNGKKSFIKGNGGWGYAARTAIGQRADGIILILVVDSNASRTKGASMVDLTEIMSNYGAVNASNLDGGTSSVLVLPKKEALKYINECNNDYCYINDPIDSSLQHKTRGIPTSIIVSEEK